MPDEPTTLTTPGPDAAALGRLHVDQRVPDPAHIAKLPKPTNKNNDKGRCNECGGWHGLPAVHLDYMGHAEVTDVLLAADPLWSWEPVAWADNGQPAILFDGNQAVMWIRLTVHGHSRLGVGTAPQSKDELHKELIGDAIRNAAMRFGIAVTLWSKADGVERQIEADLPEPITGDHVRAIEAGIGRLDDDTKAGLKRWWSGQGLPSLKSGMLSAHQADTILDYLMALPVQGAHETASTPSGDDTPPAPPEEPQETRGTLSAEEYMESRDSLPDGRQDSDEDDTPPALPEGVVVSGDLTTADTREAIVDCLTDLYAKAPGDLVAEARVANLSQGGTPHQLARRIAQHRLTQVGIHLNQTALRDIAHQEGLGTGGTDTE